MDCFHAGIYGNLQTICQIFRKGNRRNHIGYRRVMDHVFAVSVHLTFIPVLSAIPLAVQIFLIFAPCDTGHQMDDIALFSVLTDSLRHCRIDSVHHDKVTAKVYRRPDLPACLIACQFLFFRSDISHLYTLPFIRSPPGM